MVKSWLNTIIIFMRPNESHEEEINFTPRNIIMKLPRINNFKVNSKVNCLQGNNN